MALNNMVMMADGGGSGSGRRSVNPALLSEYKSIIDEEKAKMESIISRIKTIKQEENIDLSFTEENKEILNKVVNYTEGFLDNFGALSEFFGLCSSATEEYMRSTKSRIANSVVEENN